MTSLREEDGHETARKRLPGCHGFLRKIVKAADNVSTVALGGY